MFLECQYPCAALGQLWACSFRRTISCPQAPTPLLHRLTANAFYSKKKFNKNKFKMIICRRIIVCVLLVTGVEMEGGRAHGHYCGVTGGLRIGLFHLEQLGYNTCKKSKTLKMFFAFPTRFSFTLRAGEFARETQKATWDEKG
jgi:hypothetical protein